MNVDRHRAGQITWAQDRLFGSLPQLVARKRWLCRQVIYEPLSQRAIQNTRSVELRLPGGHPPPRQGWWSGVGGYISREHGQRDGARPRCYRCICVSKPQHAIPGNRRRRTSLIGNSSSGFEADMEAYRADGRAYGLWGFVQPAIYKCVRLWRNGAIMVLRLEAAEGEDLGNLYSRSVLCARGRARPRAGVSGSRIKVSHSIWQHGSNRTKNTGAGGRVSGGGDCFDTAFPQHGGFCMTQRASRTVKILYEMIARASLEGREDRLARYLKS